MRIRDLKDTVSLMTSDDYKDRLLARILAVKNSASKATSCYSKKKPAIRPRYKNSDRRAPGAVACNGEVPKPAKTKS